MERGIHQWAIQYFLKGAFYPETVVMSSIVQQFQGPPFDVSFLSMSELDRHPCMTKITHTKWYFCGLLIVAGTFNYYYLRRRWHITLIIACSQRRIYGSWSYDPCGPFFLGECFLTCASRQCLYIESTCF